MLARSRKRQSDARIPRGARAPTGAVELALRELKGIEDPDTLFAWALRVLPIRNTLSDSARGTLEAALFEEADEVNADPEVLIALEQSRPERNGLAPAPDA